jgi:hypothetical protein
MTKSIQPLTPRSFATGPSPALKNPAVAHCCDAFERVYKAVWAKKKSDYFALRDAGKAYREAMPPLSGYQSICDFIACTAHGILIEAVSGTSATKLLYAAQVALSTIPQQSKNQAPRPETPAQTPTPLPVLVPGRT